MVIVRVKTKVLGKCQLSSLHLMLCYFIESIITIIYVIVNYTKHDVTMMSCVGSFKLSEPTKCA